MVSKKSKNFFLIVLLVFYASAVYTYYDTVVLKNFDIFLSEEEVPSYDDLLSKFRVSIGSYVR